MLTETIEAIDEGLTFASPRLVVKVWNKMFPDECISMADFKNRSKEETKSLRDELREMITDELSITDDGKKIKSVYRMITGEELDDDGLDKCADEDDIYNEDYE